MSNEEKLYGPVFHGGRWNGKDKIKMNRGALGHGAYFTPDVEIAREYAKLGNLTKAYLKLENPLLVEIKDEDNTINRHPCVLALMNLGMTQDKAEKKVEKAEEEEGYLGKEISTIAKKKGYDGLLLAINGKVTEIVIWDSNQVRV